MLLVAAAAERFTVHPREPAHPQVPHASCQGRPGREAAPRRRKYPVGDSPDECTPVIGTFENLTTFVSTATSESIFVPDESYRAAA